MTRQRARLAIASAIPLILVFVVICVSLAAQRALARFEFDGRTLKNVVFKGEPVALEGEPRISAVVLERVDGSRMAGGLEPTTRTFEDGLLSMAFDWGRVEVKYSVLDQRTLGVDVRVDNTSPDIIRAISIELLQTNFADSPAGWQENFPVLTHNIGSPSIVTVKTGKTAFDLRNEEIGRPLIVGFPGRQSTTKRPLLVSSTNDGWLSPYLDPYVDRPIHPGGTDRYRVSLRFRSAQDDPEEASGDLRRRFAQSYPPSLSWKDRRPVGALFLSSAGLAAPGNPRGWFGDKDLDIRDEAGRETFRSRLVDYAKRSVALLKSIDAQGMILWDPEGQEQPHPTSYLCDPRSLPPEIAPAIDEFFAVFSQAGLRTGLCVRPQLPVRAAYTDDARQVDVADVVGNLADKIEYAKRRWGTTLFYVDSNGDPNVPLPADVFRRLAKVHPNVLVMPEHKNTLYHSLAAPFYSFVHHGVASTPESVRMVYPSSFSAIYVADGDVSARKAELVKAVRSGDILVLHAWYDTPNRAAVKEIYEEAGRP